MIVPYSRSGLALSRAADSMPTLSIPNAAPGISHFYASPQAHRRQALAYFDKILLWPDV